VEGLNPVFGRVITKAMERKPEDRFQSVDEMLHALCPEDHSSYLPAPASLSMIGDRAANRRGKPPVQIPSAGIADTFVPTPSLVDTREDSQSQPFERPGVIVPDSLPSWLHHAGLSWQPNQEVASGDAADAESVSWTKRATTAVLVSWCFAVMSAILSPPSDLGFLALLAVFPAAGFAACWAFRQMLPRVNSGRSFAMNRVVGAAVVCCIGVIIYFVLRPSGTGGFGRGRDGGFLSALLLGGLLIDWRCFISVHRYPRVGILKTLTVLFGFVLAMMIAEANGEQVIQTLLLMLMAATLSIQILAPHGHVRSEKASALERTEPHSNDQDLQSDTPLSDTRLDSESFLLKEEV
jgi:hypothetical protein